MVSMGKSEGVALFGFVVVILVFIVDRTTRPNSNISERVIHEQFYETLVQTNETHLKRSSGFDYDKSVYSILQPNITYCEDILKGKKEDEVQRAYHAIRTSFDIVLQTKGNIDEGHSGRKKTSIYTYLHLAKLGFVNTICETGFNAGHSTLAWLTGNPHAHVYSFDLGLHPISKPMADFLNQSFPGRLTNIWGDSTFTIPTFIKNNPNVICDLIIVDGGHYYEVALADLQNLRHLANPKYNLVIIDDCPNIVEVNKAWTQMQMTKDVQKIWTCEFWVREKGSFSVGKYLKKFL